MTSKEQEYKKDMHSIALEYSLTDKELEEIEKSQFEFLADCIKNLKTLRIPSFGVFDLKTRYKNGTST